MKSNIARVLSLTVVCTLVPGCFRIGPQGSGPSGPLRLRYTLKGHAEWIHSVAFSPDGTTLASGGEDKKIILWNLATGKMTATLHTADAAEWVAFNPNGKTLAAAVRSQIELWDVAAGIKTDLGVGNGRSSGITQFVAFSPTGTSIASAGVEQPIFVRDVPAGQVVAQFPPGEPFIQALAFSPDGKTVATAGQKHVLLWDVAAEKLSATLPTSAPVLSLAFSPDGKSLAGGSMPPSGSIMIWDIDSKKCRTFATTPVRLYGLAYSPDGKIVACGGEGGSVDLWNVSSGSVVASVQVTNLVRAVAFSPDGKMLAAGLVDHSVLVWDVPGGK